MKFIKDIAKIVNLMKNKKWNYLIALFVCGSVDPLYRVGYAMVFKKIVNAVEYGETDLLVTGITVMLVLIVIYCVVQPIAAYFYEGRLYYPITELHMDIVKNILKYPNSYFDKNHSGDIMSRLTTDLQQLSVFYREYSYDVVSNAIYGIGSFICIAILDIRFIPIMLVLGILSVKLNKMFVNESYKLNVILQEGAGRVNEWFSDLIAGFHTMKTLGAGRNVFHYFEKDCNNVYRAGVQYGKMNGKRNGINHLLAVGNFTVVLLIGIFMVQYELSDMGTVIAIATLQTGISTLFIEMGKALSQFQNSIVGAKRIFELLEQPKEKEGNKVVENKEMNLTFDNVSFAYNEDHTLPALINVSFSCSPGGITSVVGESGSGKSTIFKVLLGLYQGYKGSIRVFGSELKEYKLHSIREHIGFVPQDAHMFNATIMENIRVGNKEATDLEVKKAAELAVADSFISELKDGYNTLIGKGGVVLSGGQKQRIELARVLLKKSEIVVLDEVTSALDTVSDAAVRKALENISKEKIVIMISHRLETVKYSTNIIVMENGMAVEIGNHDELLQKKNVYWKMWGGEEQPLT
jgi:ATP-binding cassette, subfamily B, bacterial